MGLDYASRMMVPPQWAQGMGVGRGQWGVEAGRMPTQLGPHHAEYEADWVMRPDRYVFDRPMEPATKDELKDPKALLEKRAKEFEGGKTWSNMMTESMHGGVINSFNNAAPSVRGKVPALSKPAASNAVSKP